MLILLVYSFQNGSASIILQKTKFRLDFSLNIRYNIKVADKKTSITIWRGILMVRSHIGNVVCRKALSVRVASSPPKKKSNSLKTNCFSFFIVFFMICQCINANFSFKIFFSRPRLFIVLREIKKDGAYLILFGMFHFLCHLLNLDVGSDYAYDLLHK